MEFCHTNPFIRFAEIIHFHSPGIWRCVKDYRIFYILSGEAEISIDSNTYPLVPHSVFYCSAGSTYKIKSQGIDLIAIDFDLTQERNNEEAPYPPINPTEDTNYIPIDGCQILSGYTVLHNGMEHYPLLSKISEEFAARKPLYRETCSALLKALLAQLVRSSTEPTSQATASVQKVLSYIDANYHLPLTNKNLAEMTGYHEYHLNRLFIKHTGFTIRQYIINVRIVQAKKLLLSTDLSMSALAEKVGFNSNTYFSSYFKQFAGISPLEFRNRFKNSI